VCSEDRKCYIDQLPKNSGMDNQFGGGFQDPNELVPFPNYRSKAPDKHAKSRHGQEGEGGHRVRRPTKKSATAGSSSNTAKSKNHPSLEEKKSKTKVEKGKGKITKSPKKTGKFKSSRCCCTIVKGKK
jgi:hypothetical protein